MAVGRSWVSAVCQSTPLPLRDMPVFLSLYLFFTVCNRLSSKSLYLFLHSPYLFFTVRTCSSQSIILIHSPYLFFTICTQEKSASGSQVLRLRPSHALFVSVASPLANPRPFPAGILVHDDLQFLNLTSAFPSLMWCPNFPETCHSWIVCRFASSLSHSSRLQRAFPSRYPLLDGRGLCCGKWLVYRRREKTQWGWLPFSTFRLPPVVTKAFKSLPRVFATCWFSRIMLLFR
jgi:hypothetical protein